MKMRYYLMIALLFALFGCSDDATKEAENLCGDGDTVQRNDETYCYYSAALIIEGFDCPPDFAHRFDRPNGAVLCSSDPNLMDDELDDIIEFWELRENSELNNENNVNNVNNANNLNNVNNTNNANNIEPGVCPNELSVGDNVVVIDWECPVKECCGGGSFLASCPNMGGDYFCWENAFGWYDCSSWDENQMTACPVPAGDEGDLCAWPLDEDACADGLYCDGRGDFPPMFPGEGGSDGICQSLPALCNGDACFTDDDCTNAQRGSCYGGDILSGTVGVCRAKPTGLKECVGSRDCPYDWTCENATLGCDDACGCSNVAAADTVGQCTKVNGGSTPGLFLRNPENLTWNSTLEVYWTKPGIGADPNYITCPAYEVQVSDPQTGWVTIAEEPCPNGEGGLRELAADSFVRLGDINLGITNRTAPGVIRLRGEYLTQCTGLDPATCTGPFERFSPAQWEVE